jgi:pimeloyl-ACP methyl ester carboxylesterase
VARDERVALPVGSGGETLAVRYAAPAAAASAGERLPILYLHGFGSHQSGDKAALFRARAGAAGHSFCSFDFRGHGESGGALLDLTFSRLLEDVAAVRAFLAERGHRRLALFGSSLGGAVALWHAAVSEGVAAVAAVAPAVGLLGTIERWAGAAGLARWQREGAIRFGNELVDTDIGWDLVADLRRHDFVALAARHRTPTLVFQGQRDLSVRWQDVQAFADRCRPGTLGLRLYPAGDHRLLDQLGEIWEETAKFLARVEGRERRPAPPAADQGSPARR